MSSGAADCGPGGWSGGAATGGAFVANVFQGGSEKQLLDVLKRNFASVRHAKPPASRLLERYAGRYLVLVLLASFWTFQAVDLVFLLPVGGAGGANQTLVFHPPAPPTNVTAGVSITDPGTAPIGRTGLALTPRDASARHFAANSSRITLPTSSRSVGE